MCGEKKYDGGATAVYEGSPPRVRGKVYTFAIYKQMHWITPACAGKRRLSAIHAVNILDHPRVCGEKVFPFLSVAVYQGSPPRVRGKVTLGLAL